MILDNLLKKESKPATLISEINKKESVTGLDFFLDKIITLIGNTHVLKILENLMGVCN